MSSFYQSHTGDFHNNVIKKMFCYSVLFAIPTHFISRCKFLLTSYENHSQSIQAIGETDYGKKKAVPSIFFSGSLTVEAALVLPLFLSAVFLLAGFFQMLAVCEQVNLHLCNIGRELAAYSEAEDGSELSDFYRLFYLSIADSVIDQSHIKGGYKGILLNLSDEEDVLKLSVGYRVMLDGYLIGERSVWVNDAIYIRPWIGGGIPQNKDDTADESRLVYVAVNGQVYHRSDNCTYLLLSVRQCSMEMIESIRNKYGAKYIPCEKCGTEAAGRNMFITDTGRAWHSNRYCSGLKREYFTMHEEKALSRGLVPCSRCGGS